VALRDTLEDWERLYRGLVAKYEITGIQRFSPSYFAALAEMPQITALAAYRGAKIVAMSLWAQGEGVVYSHLAASAPEGYEVQAMYGLYSEASACFADTQIIHLGGGAGLDTGADGLGYFKRGFANRKVTAYLCGSCLHPDKYALLTSDQPETSYFPAYRQP
jgi:hypothetical protein